MISRPLKLALVTRRFPPLIGGAERVFYYLAGALAASGAYVTVVTSQVPGSELPMAEHVPFARANHGNSTALDQGGELIVVRLATSQLRFWGTWRYMQNLKRWFERNAVDLAYVSMLKHDAYVVAREGKRLGFPVVLRPEGAGATGDLAWQSWGNFGRQIGLACRLADAIVSISTSVEGEVRQSFRSGTMRPRRRALKLDPGEREPRIVSISNGVPVPQSAWRIRTGWCSAPRAFFVGRLAPEKGLDTLIAAWPDVRTRFPTAQLILAGEGPERDSIEKQARALALSIGPGQALEMPGSISDSMAALKGADLFVLPSREEGMSIALLEAMALGIPVVASSIPGNRSLIDDREHGRLVSPGEPAELARAIIEQWEDLDRASQMGLAARSRVEREFSIQAVAEKHLALFQELVACRS
jgi:glycosyltransferase involved in cell wall biosynthesis